jgi:glycosyltransferase involved in cell wall biosynthesis
VITDAQKIREYYWERYGKDSTFIAYGAETSKVSGTDHVRRLGLEPGRYVLYVSRMEPENNALLVREAFEKIDTDYKLVLVGDAPYAVEYIRRVKATTDRRVVIAGAIYGEGYRQLQSHCAVYVQATEVGGTHPALVEAMGRGALVLYLDTPESTEVAGGTAVPFANDLNDLTEKLCWAVRTSDSERAMWGERARERIERLYSWNAITDQYEALLGGLGSK